MTDFDRTHPGDWPSGAPVGSPEITDLDKKTAKALNRFGGNLAKGSGGDDGVFTMGSDTVLKVGWAAGASIPTVWIRGGKILLDTDGSHRATVSGPAFDATISGSSTMTFSGTAGMTFGSGTTITMNASSTFTSHGTITSDGALTLQNGSDTTFQSGALLELTDQYPLLKVGHPGRTTFQRYSLVSPIVYGSGWTNTVDGVKSPSNTSGTPGQVSLPPPWNGCTLTGITLYFTPVVGGRDGTIPAVPQSLQLLKRQVSAGTPLPAWTVVGTATYTFPAYGTYIAGNVLSLTLALTEVIDRTAYEYAVKIVDESSTHSVGGTVFHQVALGYTVPSLQPQ